jgi:hypothetical protein
VFAKVCNCRLTLDGCPEKRTLLKMMASHVGSLLTYWLNVGHVYSALTVGIQAEIGGTGIGGKLAT